MKAYCIRVKGNDYSEAVAARCLESAKRHGVRVELFDATPKEIAVELMHEYGLEWAWANGNTSNAVCPHTGLKQHPYKTHDLRQRIGCAMSHYRLWLECIEANEDILILEHDTVFLRPLPEIHLLGGALMLNDPKGATPRGDWWREQIIAKGDGIHDKTVIFNTGQPDGLAGNSAYVITPGAARVCVHSYERCGVWPNDATLCRQLVPGLREIYPFVTEVRPYKTLAEGY